MFPLLFFKDDDDKKEGKKEAKEKKQPPPAPTESSKNWNQNKGWDTLNWDWLVVAGVCECVCACACVRACTQKHDQTLGSLIMEGAL